MMGGGTGRRPERCNDLHAWPWHMQRMLQAADAFPMNLGFFGKGNASLPGGLVEQIEAGACGLKLHEDWGTTPAAIDCCLSVADDLDVQVLIHTDSLNESGFVENTIAAFKGRTIHTFHTEGAGGGHAPDIIKSVRRGQRHPVLDNSDSALHRDTVEEALDMVMVTHHLDRRIPEDVAFAESRIRKETIAAEDLLQDMGALSIVSSDSQAMGRARRSDQPTWQTADKMKKQFGRLSEEQGDNDNFRARRYISKYTINPAISQGISTYVGSIEVGKLADLVYLGSGLFRREARHGAQVRDDHRRYHGRSRTVPFPPPAGILPPNVRCLWPIRDRKLGHIRQPG